jgi:putative membrane protein
MKLSVVLGLLTVLAASSGYAGQQGAGKANNTTTFLTHAAQDGEAEIELGRLAQAQAADAKVKDFGARMQKDHGNANAELRAIAAKKGLTIPGGPGPHAAMKAKLEKLQGATFDQAYMKAMVDDHTKAVKEFQLATNSPDADVKAFAAKTLPTLQEHLKLAQEVHKAVSSSMRSSAAIDKPAPTTGGTQGRDATQPRK